MVESVLFHRPCTIVNTAMVLHIEGVVEVTIRIWTDVTNTPAATYFVSNAVEAHGYGFRSTVVRVSIHVARQVQ